MIARYNIISSVKKIITGKEVVACPIWKKKIRNEKNLENRNFLLRYLY